MSNADALHLRQRLLVLWAGVPSPSGTIVAWSRFDGTGRTAATTGDEAEPPYTTVQAAMEDGWRVIQFPEPSAPPTPGQEFATGALRYQFVLERLTEV